MDCLTGFARDIAARARWARDHNDSIPKAAWSTGEKLAVALVLGSSEYLDQLGYSRAEGEARLAGDLLGADVSSWLDQVRGAL